MSDATFHTVGIHPRPNTVRWERELVDGLAMPPILFSHNYFVYHRTSSITDLHCFVTPLIGTQLKFSRDI